MLPCLHHDAVPVDIVHDAVFVIIEDEHVVSTPVIEVSNLCAGVIGDHLYVGLPVSVRIAPVDRKIMRTGIYPVPVPVDQQAVVVGIARPVG